jgi:hypothetical protein
VRTNPVASYGWKFRRSRLLKALYHYGCLMLWDLWVCGQRVALSKPIRRSGVIPTGLAALAVGAVAPHAIGVGFPDAW